MGIKTLIMILASLSFSVSALADNHEGGEKKPFSITGDFASSIMFVDNENGAGGVNGPHDEFNVDLVEVNLEKNWSKSKLHLSIGYGNTANAMNANSANQLNLMNAYYSLDTSYGLNFMFGKFESPVGHETYNHMDNSQYTRSYGFALAPFFSNGLGLNYGQGMWKAGFIVSNGQGSSTDDNDNNKTMAVTFDVDPMENLGLDLNYVTGSEANNAVTVLDFSVSYMINEMFDIALNYVDHGRKPAAAGSTELKATSMAAYVNANMGMYGIGLRYEQFTYDETNTTTPAGGIVYNGTGVNGLGATGNDNTITSITLAAKAELDQNANAFLEYRMDSADDKVWTDKDNQAADSNNTMTVGVMYRF